MFYFPKTCRSFICKLKLSQLIEFDKDFFKQFPFHVFDYYNNIQEFEDLEGEIEIKDYKTFTNDLRKKSKMGQFKRKNNKQKLDYTQFQE